MTSTDSPPLIDISSLFRKESARESSVAARAIGEACRNNGFFYIINHGVNEALQKKLEQLSKEFFALEESEKMKISMSKGGRAWRGYFPVGGELTSGKPDLKEGIYFGEELEDNDPRVKASLPMHGKNLFPAHPKELRTVVLEYMAALAKVGHALMKGIALSLDLNPNYFYKKYTANPLPLFRIFHYPAQPEVRQQWGVGEHTDYGVLTILKQDAVGGLQVKSNNRWINAPPIPGTFICNIGDMLDRMTGGLYRSTPHRVLNTSGKSRYSYPFFFDPDFESKVQKIKGIEKATDNRAERWDKESVHDFEGTYGDYLLRKVGKVFPELQRKVF